MAQPKGYDHFLGLNVRTADGSKLGKVTEVGSDSFKIERGLIFSRRRSARYVDICGIRNGELILAHNKGDWKGGKIPERRADAEVKTVSTTIYLRGGEAEASSGCDLHHVAREAEVDAHVRAGCNVCGGLQHASGK